MKENVITARQEEILTKINEAGFLTIEELAERFGKTTQTIRSDVADLARKGRIRRYHGGAAGMTNRYQTPYNHRRAMNHPAKQRIAEEAAKLINDGVSLYLGIGTTAEAVAHALKLKRDLRVVTNNPNIVSILAENETADIYLAGGEIRRSDMAVLGETALEFLNNFRVDFTVIGISGIDASGDLLNYDMQETGILRSMVSTAKKVILVADSSKFNSTPLYRVANIKDIDRFFTESTPPKAILSICEKYNVDVTICR